ncbi:hypothetical protein EYZ11_011610 [Aspergillus tanneri]|uniref:Uncharacterized protein n=1 Tax=Aspergillus tanneri TaxID=1220188 RepID=A0A4S3J2C4_9EURO|nr:hypothetical protein EYZ11_011610 [Aspergillus tanneri]
MYVLEDGKIGAIANVTALAHLINHLVSTFLVT